MLSQLLKHEIKAYSKIFLPIYALTLVISLLMGLSGHLKSQIFDYIPINLILSFAFVALIVAVFILSITMIVRRFSKNLLSDEGYLMFTLPTTSEKLILSKCLVSVLFSILNIVIVILAFLLLITPALQFNSDIDIFKFLKLFNENVNFMDKSVLSSILLFLCINIMFILQIYFALSIGQLPKLNNHRKISSFLTFIGITFICDKVLQFIFKLFYSSRIGDIADPSSNVMLGSSMIMLCISAVLFFGVTYILNKKLNLE